VRHRRTTQNHTRCASIVAEMVRFNALTMTFQDFSALAFPLLRWILRSNRTHLELIPKANQIERMQTPFQFQVRFDIFCSANAQLLSSYCRLCLRFRSMRRNSKGGWPGPKRKNAKTHILALTSLGMDPQFTTFTVLSELARLFASSISLVSQGYRCFLF